LNKRVLAILDGEERYAYGLMEYFEEKSNLPFRVHVFTDRKKFYSFGKKEEIECLLASENVFDNDLEKYRIPHIIILSESGNCINPTLHHVNKFQSCENIYKEILQYYSEHQDGSLAVLRKNTKKLKIIGIYTPIGRCLQTTFAFSLGQLLSINHKTLYMNFEKYSGLSQLLKRQFDSDMADLMYYFECAKEKLAYRVDSIAININGLDYIPPASVYQNLAGIRGDQWIELFMEMEKCTEYEYLILDMTDGMIDLWNVLKFCDVVYTISRGDTMAIAKINQYEKTLGNSGYSEILSKTRKCSFPIFQQLPQKFDELTKGELARFIKDRILPDVLSLDELEE